MQVKHKALLSKIVIGYLIEARRSREIIEYDDLLATAEEILPTDISAADEIIKYSDFILAQVFHHLYYYYVYTSRIFIYRSKATKKQEEKMMKVS
jgi:hypothetical protein